MTYLPIAPESPTSSATSHTAVRKRVTAVSGVLSAVFVACASQSALAAPEGKLDEEMQLSLAPGINTHVSVISDDGQTYSRFKPGSSINLGGPIKIKMKTGRIRTWSIYWGFCNDDDCNKFIGNALLDGHHVGDAKLVQKVIGFPLENDNIPGANGVINPNPTAAQIISQCNQKAHNAPVNKAHFFSKRVPVSLGIDTYIQVLPDPPIATPGPARAADIDHAKTVMVSLPIKCEPLQPTPKVAGDIQTELPELELVATELALQKGQQPPAHSLNYAGSCPLGITLHVGATTNIKGKVHGYVQHRSVAGVDWQSSEFAMTTGSTDGALWKKVWTDLQQLPFQKTGVPLNPGGGGVVDNQPSGDVQFNPGGDTGGPAPASSVATGNHQVAEGRHIGYFRYVAYSGKMVLPVGPGGSDAVAYDNFKQTPWRKYDVTCEPKKSGVATTSPTGVVNPVPPNDGHQRDPAVMVDPDIVKKPVRVTPSRKKTVKPERRPKRVSVCKNGFRRGGKCVCRRGWKRTRVSRFEVVCAKPRPRLVCMGGRVSNKKCHCARNARKIRIGVNQWRCQKRFAKPERKVKCVGGVVRRNRCICHRGHKLVKGRCIADAKPKRVIKKGFNKRRKATSRKQQLRSRHKAPKKGYAPRRKYRRR